MTASISGCVLSALLFKLKNVTADGEGFLLGEVHTHNVENITDSQSSGTREEKRLCINSYVCFNGKYSFYDNSGALNVDKLEEELGDKHHRVIGWFSYRRNSSHRVSLRERALHRRLMNYYEAKNTKDFIFALITDHLEEPTCIHTTDYSFYHWIASCPQQMKVEIVNLRASAAVPYQALPVTRIPPSLTHYSTVLEQQRRHFMDADGNMIQAKAVENLYRALIQRLEPLSLELAQSTEEVQGIGGEVEKLRQRVDAMRKEQEKLFHQQREEEQAAMLVDIHSPPPAQTAQEEDDKMPMLIDLMSDSPPTAAEITTHTSVKPISHDQSHDDLLGSSAEASNHTHLPQSEILQPEVLTQSQELF